VTPANVKRSHTRVEHLKGSKVRQNFSFALEFECPPFSARIRDRKPFHFYEPLQVDVSSMNLEARQ
jgi:hypothetical protein